MPSTSSENPSLRPFTPANLQPVVGGRGPIVWVGGKRLLAKRIVPLIPVHKTYVEVFAGGAGAMFRKPPSAVEIINDINSELCNLYRVLKWHLEEFVRCFKWALVAREEFKRHLRERPDTLTDIHRAARFFYLNRLAYGGKSDLVGQHMAVPRTAPPGLNLLRLEETLSAVHLRLSSVWIENLPFQKLIARYDHADTFFYADPPYWGHEDDYGKALFSPEDFGALEAILGQAKGRWMVSLNDVPEVRAIFARWRIESVETKYSLGTKGQAAQKAVGEVLIMNY